MTERKIGLREVRALKPGQTVWDTAVAGFGARRQQSPAVSYVLIYRTPVSYTHLTLPTILRV